MPGRSTGEPRDDASPVARDLWVCPRCSRTFANRNQTHACRPLVDLDQHFTGKDPQVREAFDAVLAEVRRLGPVTVLPQSTRVALQVRMSFAAFVPRRRWLDGHVVLARRLDHPRFRRVEEYSPRNVLHGFRLLGPEDVDAAVRSWLAEAYLVGCQDHLHTDPPDGTTSPNPRWV
ncbi:MAG TPA: DUF5655 domain-containing protein [Mycobacteriales bacterium]